MCPFLFLAIDSERADNSKISLKCIFFAGWCLKFGFSPDIGQSQCKNTPKDDFYCHRNRSKCILPRNFDCTNTLFVLDVCEHIRNEGIYKNKDDYVRPNVNVRPYCNSVTVYTLPEQFDHIPCIFLITLLSHLEWNRQKKIWLRNLFISVLWLHMLIHFAIFLFSCLAVKRYCELVKRFVHFFVSKT